MRGILAASLSLLTVASASETLQTDADGAMQYWTNTGAAWLAPFAATHNLSNASIRAPQPEIRPHIPV